jgi:hypothetical protein
MNSDKTLPTLLSFLVLALLVGCNRGFDFQREYQRAYNAYFGADRIAAKNSLLVFVERAERNEQSAKRVKDLDSDRVLAMSWLRLASCYEDENAKGTEAVQRALQYFDRIPQIAADVDYQKDKRKWALNFLQKAESYQAPVWKRKPDASNEHATAK